MIDPANRTRRPRRNPGPVPFGWRLGAAGLITPDAREQAALSLIHALHRKKVSVRAIAAILTRSKVSTRRGAGLWRASSVQDLLKRPPIPALG